MTKRDTLMSEQDGIQVSTLHRPANDDEEAWIAYWQAQDQPWRTEPEIDVERKRFLAERRSFELAVIHGNYPFMNIKLSRADVEWLLATHENGRGPIDWFDGSQRKRPGLDLSDCSLSQVNLGYLPLTKCYFHRTRLQNTNFNGAQLQGVYFFQAQLQGANFTGAQLQGANLTGAQLQNANFVKAYLQDVDLKAVELANEQHIGPKFADVHWGDTNLAVVDWAKINILGDEYEALKEDDDFFSLMPDYDYDAAVRAYRQLSVVLRNQGLNENAARFTYRAQLMQRKVFWYQRKFVKYLGSLFLDLLSGYGYKPLRCFAAYLIVILSFATAYFVIGHKVGTVLSPLGSVVFSMTSFHGRGFFPGGITLDDPLTVVAALEALIGLLIEVTFIATLTQRLFGK